MFVFNQKRDQMINLDNVLNIKSDNEFISYRYSGIDRYHVIGRYGTEKRAREVLEEIVSRASDTRYVYYMPEK